MKSVGLFEAKTKLSEICSQVAAGGGPVVVTRRGKPLVRIEPIPASRAKPASVWDRRAELERKQGRWTEELPLPARQKQTWRSPLED